MSTQSKIPYTIHYLDNLDFINELGSTQSNLESGYNLTTSIAQMNLFIDMFRPLRLVFRLDGNNDLFMNSSRGGIVLTMRMNSTTVNRLFAIKNIQSSFIPENGSTQKIVTCEAYHSVFSPKFSKRIEGSFQNVIENMMNVVYDTKGLTVFKPHLELTGQGVECDNILQGQSVDEYIKYSARSVLDSADGTPYFVFDNFHGLVGSSIQELFKNRSQNTITVVSKKNVGETSLYTPIPLTAKSDKFLIPVTDYLQETEVDPENFTKLQRSVFYVPSPNGDIIVYRNINDASQNPTLAANDDIRVVNTYHEYKNEGPDRYGYHTVLCSYINDILSTGRASFDYHIPDLTTVQVGDVIDITRGIGTDRSQRETVLITGITLTQSNIAGTQRISCISLREYENFYRKYQGVLTNVFSIKSV